MKCERGVAKRARKAALALALTMSALSVLAQTALGTGAFPKVGAIETDLKRGVSKKSDVQKLLGVPNGGGEALLPGIGARELQLQPFQIWYYEDIELTEAKSEKDIMRMKIRQQILLVFFKGEVFHGYLWTSNGGAAEGHR
jgi:hypothetical protein